MISYIRRHLFSVIGFVIIAMGVVFFGVNKLEEAKVKEEEVIKINTFYEEESDDDYSVIANNQSLDEDKDIVFDKYIALLEIPKINLKRGLSYYKNSINYNIEIVDGSSFPDRDGSNLILASHSGNSKVSFFKNLYKLVLGDKVYIYYNDFKYEFVIDDIYDVKKDGTVEIERYKDKKTITLITCKNGSDDLQEVYVGYLTDYYHY